MILIQHETSGEVQLVTDASAYGPEWAVIADPAPADFLTAPYLIENGAVVPDLETARTRQRAIVRAGRDAAMRSNVTVPGLGTFQIAGDGWNHVMGFYFRAKDAVRFDEAYSRPFKLADNTMALFDAAQWVTIGEHCEAELQARFARGEVLLGRIEAATTLADIADVVWTLED